MPWRLTHFEPKINIMRILIRLILSGLPFVFSSMVCSAEVHKSLLHAENRLPPPRQPVQVLQAGYLGTSGADFLNSAAVLPDGRLILAGAHLGGGDKQTWGVPWRVLGEDSPMPDYVRVNDKRGDELIAEQNEHATGFFVILSKDRSRIEEAVRLPWKSGSITSIAVDEKGVLYLGGTAQSNLKALGPSKDITVAELIDIHGAGAEVSRGFVCRVSPDRTRVEWVRDFWTTEIKIPRSKDSKVRHGHRPVSLVWETEADQLRVTAGSRWFLGADGELIESSVLRGTGARLAVRADGKAAWGGDLNTYLGGNGASRGPYRKPYLYVTEPNGRKRFRYFDWESGMLNHTCWLVADSSALAFHFDREGMLYQAGWAHGGNSPYAHFPQDLRASLPVSARLFPPMSGSPSALFLHRLDPNTGGVLAAQCILSVSPTSGKANGAWADWMDSAHDGSLIVAGNSSAHMMQTPDRLDPDAEPKGASLWVLNRDLTELRFASIVPGVYAADIVAGWEWSSSCLQVDGRNLVIVFSGARLENGKAPQVNPLQVAFGGGTSDGWFLIFDLGPADTPLPPPATAKLLPPPTQPEPMKPGLAKGVKHGAGRSFYLGHDFPRFPTTLVELRDPKGDKWPLFLHGKVKEGGQIVLNEANPSARFSLRSDVLATPMGEEHPVLFRELLEPGSRGRLTFPEIRVEVEETEGPAQIRKGRRSSGLRFQVKGTVRCGERSAPVDLVVSGSIRQQVQLDFVGGSGGSPLSFPGHGGGIRMMGWVPADLFPGGEEGEKIHLTLSAYLIEEGLREKILTGQIDPVLGSQKLKGIWEREGKRWLKKARNWLPSEPDAETGTP